MAQLKIFHDRAGNTLTVWFGDPAEESLCEEADDDVVLIKDKDGRVIGFEKLNFSLPSVAGEEVHIAYEEASV